MLGKQKTLIITALLGISAPGKPNMLDSSKSSQHDTIQQQDNYVDVSHAKNFDVSHSQTQSKESVLPNPIKEKMSETTAPYVKLNLAILQNPSEYFKPNQNDDEQKPYTFFNLTEEDEPKPQQENGSEQKSEDKPAIKVEFHVGNINEKPTTPQKEMQEEQDLDGTPKNPPFMNQNPGAAIPKANFDDSDEETEVAANNPNPNAAIAMSMNTLTEQHTGATIAKANTDESDVETEVAANNPNTNAAIAMSMDTAANPSAAIAMSKNTPANPNATIAKANADESDVETELHANNPNPNATIAKANTDESDVETEVPANNPNPNATIAKANADESDVETELPANNPNPNAAIAMSKNTPVNPSAAIAKANADDSDEETEVPANNPKTKKINQVSLGSKVGKKFIKGVKNLLNLRKPTSKQLF